MGIYMNRPITIAVPKGYLFSETLKVLGNAGITFPDDITKSRRLFTMDDSGRYKLLLVRPWDVPAYVQQGAADLGVVGQDVLFEQEPELLILKDLKFGACKLVIAGPEGMTKDSLRHHCRVVTKFTHSASKYFDRIGKKVKIIKLYGAIELGPLIGLSDVICDLTATGSTLREHNLNVIDTVFESTAHLVANPVGMRIYYKEITTLLKSI